MAIEDFRLNIEYLRSSGQFKKTEQAYFAKLATQAKS